MPQKTLHPSIDIHHLNGLLMAAMGASLFSMKGIVMKLAFLRGASVEQMMTLRLGISIPFFILIAVWVYHRQKPDLPSYRDVGITLLLGILSYYFCTWLDFTGLQFISAQLERLILFLYPTIVALLAWWFLGDKFTWPHISALLLSYFGVAILALNEFNGFGSNAILGAGLVFACACLFACYVVASKPMITRLGVPIFTALAMGGASVAMCLHYSISLTTGTQTPVWTGEILILATVMALFCTVCAALLMNAGIARIGPGLASATGGIGPAITAIFAVLILDEAFGWQQAIALILTVSGVLLLTQVRRGTRQTKTGS